MITNNFKLFSTSLLISCFCLFLSAKAQLKDSVNTAVLKTDTAACDQIFVQVEEMPEFPGGEEGMKEFIQKNKIYPSFEKKNDITGTVYVYFVINRRGEVENPQIARGVKGHPNFDKEAIRIVSIMPGWKVGRQNLRPACVQFTIPIHFR